MTQALTPRQDGDRFQARLFWLSAARLLIPDSPVARVGFEQGPKAYDDVWVQYEPGRGQRDAYGEPLVREHVQAKWHSSPSTYGYRDLIDPGFVNANRHSLLERAALAQASLTAEQGLRFKLVTNWPIDPKDPLAPLVSNRSGGLRLDRFQAGGKRSAVGKLRALWAKHLGLDEAALFHLARSLGFGLTHATLDGLRAELDPIFHMAGLRRVPPAESGFVYDDLAFQWMSQGRLEHDRASFRDLCSGEGLLAEAPRATISFGVKSFAHPFDPLEHRCREVLDLTGQFDQRFIRDEAAWATSLWPALCKFLARAAGQGERLSLALDAHLTLAFAAGAILDLKSGRVVEIEQRSPARRIWAPDHCETDPAWPRLETTLIRLEGGGDGLAVALALTHDIEAEVRRYLSAEQGAIGRLLVCRPAGGAGALAVRSGRHAFDLAAAIAAAVRAARPAAAESVHLFIAAPNALTFFLGQRRPLLGPVTLYEHDFECERDCLYQRSLILPIPSHGPTSSEVGHLPSKTDGLLTAKNRH